MFKTFIVSNIFSNSISYMTTIKIAPPVSNIDAIKAKYKTPEKMKEYLGKQHGKFETFKAKAKATEEKQEAKAKESYEKIRLYEGSISCLEKLKAKMKMILITNAHRKTLNIKLQKYDLSPYFDEMVCAHELHYVKEDVQLWYMLRSRYRIDFEKTVLIEDTIKNIHMGLSAGISKAIYLGNEKYTSSNKILSMSSINDIPSAFN